MYNRIYKFFSCNDFIYPLQFGFRKVYSTVHTLISLSESIRKNLDEGNIGCSTFFFFFFHLHKGFNAVEHDILLSKLKHYGVRG